MEQGRKNNGVELINDRSIHIINPLAVIESNITQENNGVIEKLHKGNTERD